MKHEVSYTLETKYGTSLLLCWQFSTDKVVDAGSELRCFR